MRVPGITRSHIPGSSSEIRILGVILQRSKSFVLPKSQEPVEGGLLNGTVVCIWRAGTAITDDGSGMGGIGRVLEVTPSVVIRAIVNGEGFSWGCPPLEACRTCAGMQHGKIDVGAGRVRANHEFWSGSHK